MKRLLLILTMVCLASAGWAGQISREQALQKAQQFMSLNGKHGTLTTAETAMTKARRRSMQVPDYYYVFNEGQDQGYVIVSGDDRTVPILGYSYHGTFDVDKIPCNMAAAKLRAIKTAHHGLKSAPSTNTVTAGSTQRKTTQVGNI